MHHGVATVSSVDAIGDAAELHQLLDAAAAADHRQPLSDHLRMELAHGGGPGFAAVTVREGDHLAGYAQLGSINGIRNIELVVAPGDRGDDTIARRLLAAAVDVVGRRRWRARAVVGVRRLRWRRVDSPRRPGWRRPARCCRCDARCRPTCPSTSRRDRSCPGRTRTPSSPSTTGRSPRTPSRAAGPGRRWRQREAEAWFDPAGFLLHERDGRLAAFCWTKLHHDERPVLGEIYVIAVDPDFQGLGSATSSRSPGWPRSPSAASTTGILYVDGGNTAAVTMYEHLGFTVHRTDRAFTRDVAP